MQKAWKRLTPPTREKLAELTGVQASNLSGYNTGRLPMTLEMAARICAAVPNLTVYDLGAHEAAETEEEPPLPTRLAALEADLAETTRELTRLRRRVSRLEARPWPDEDQAKKSPG